MDKPKIISKATLASQRYRRRKQIPDPAIMASLPRRKFITAQVTELTPPMMKSTSFPVSFPGLLKRFFVWIYAIVAFFTGSLWDRMLRKDSEARRAVRLRKILENSGGTFKKIGRLVAMRIDLLPWTYCLELSKIVDHMDPFPIEQAIEKIEQSVGQTLIEAFQKFDPDPIVSATCFCVYQAILHDGQKAIVKVRRPQIGEMLLTDIKALDWLLKISEFLSIIRLGFTKNVYFDLQATIEDELNFTFEARNQTLFRKEAKRTKKKFFTSPKIFFDLSSEEVIIQEYTEGMWLWELLRAVEQNDQGALKIAEDLNIDPDLVAKRLLWVNFWGIDEHLQFIANLHADSVIVRKNSKLTFIDFSHVGSMSREKQQSLQQVMYYAWRQDPLEMARASMILLEPLPPIDTIKYTKDLEAAYWKFIYAMESKHVEWWERTSARLWLGFIKVAREHNIVMNVNVLRMIRACLLFDMIAVRLDHDLNHIKEYQKYTRYRAEFARKRFEKQMRHVVEQGINDRLYLQVEEIADTGKRLFRQLQRFLSTPVMKFNAGLGKSVYSIYTFFKLIWQSALAGSIVAGAIFSIEWLVEGNILQFNDVFYRAASNQIFYIIIFFLIFINVRVIIFRLNDTDI